MLTEEEFARALHDRTDHEPAPVDRIVSGSLARGRRVRRRRSVAQLITVTGLVVAVSITGGMIISNTDNAAITVQPAGPGAPGHSQPTGSSPGSRHQFGVSEADLATTLAATLKTLVPDGTSTDLTNQATGNSVPPGHEVYPSGGPGLSSVDGTNPERFRGASLVFDDGHGKGLVTIAVEAPAPTNRVTPAPANPQSSFCRQPGVSCKAVSGGMLVTQTAASPDGTSQVLKHISATYISDGWSVAATAYNATQGGRSQPLPHATRAEPALTTAQLATIVQDPEWLK